MHDSDGILIRQIQSGQPRLYAVLVDRYKDRALTLAARLLRSREDAEDAVQEAFVRAYRHLGRFRGDALFSTWFYRILTNTCLTHRSRARARAEWPEEGDADNAGMLTDVPDDEAGVLENLEEEEMKRIVGEEMLTLPEHHRLALTLFYVQELKYEEIATVLALPVGTIKTYLFRGRTALRRRVLARFQEAQPR